MISYFNYIDFLFTRNAYNPFSPLIIGLAHLCLTAEMLITPQTAMMLRN